MTACSCDYDRLMPFDTALKKLLASAEVVSDTETFPLDQAVGRVLADDVCSTIFVPPADNSAMDGYAVNTDKLPESLLMPVSQRITAGEQGYVLQPGTAARIFTGSEIPPGANAVIMQEQCRQVGDDIQLLMRPEAGDHIRAKGQDIQPGCRVVGRGTVLDGRHLGVIASVGVPKVKVYRRIKVAILTTGDELVLPGQPCGPGKIFNSNYFTLQALLERMGVDVIFPGIVADNPDLTSLALLEASQNADLIISSGGVSVGEEDHVKAAVESLGELMLWRLAIKPGKPLAYGRVGQTPFIGLPGNPGAVLVTFLMLARPYIRTMQGCGEVLPKLFPVKSGYERKKVVAREEFLRASLSIEKGELTAAPAHSQSSGVLSSSVMADGLLVIPSEQTVAKGDLLEFIPFNGLLA
ncbi:MAG: gephyrin-like molybdotransferase Glp [Pontibacterium sp.]